MLYWVIPDYLYRPIEFRNSSGASAWSAVFDSYGAVISQTGSLTLDSRFPGQWYQLESGLFNNWHRHYDPTLGRYTTPDPIGLDGGPNRFTYVDENPVMGIDLQGLVAISISVDAFSNTAQSSNLFSNSCSNTEFQLDGVASVIDIADITGFTIHGLNRAISRGINPGDILDAVRNPEIIRVRPNGTTQQCGGSISCGCPWRRK